MRLGVCHVCEGSLYSPTTLHLRFLFPKCRASGGHAHGADEAEAHGHDMQPARELAAPREPAWDHVSNGGHAFRALAAGP